MIRPVTALVDHIMQTRRRQYWALQSIGWGGYFGFLLLSAILWEKNDPVHTAYALMAAVTGFGVSLVIHKSLQRSWEKPPVQRAVVTALAVGLGSALWAALKFSVGLQIYPDAKEYTGLEIFIEYLHWYSYSFFILLSWPELVRRKAFHWVMEICGAPRGGMPHWCGPALAAVLAAFSPSLFAQGPGDRPGDGYDFGGGYVEGSGPGRALIGFGAFNAFNRDNPDIDVKNDEASFEARAEYQWGRKWYGFGPVVGFLGNFDGGLYGYGGVYLDFLPTPGWVVTPMAGAGAWSRGDSKELGGTFNFILQLDVAREFRNASRLGLRLTHISSAGINDPNPGVNSLLLTWSFPFDL